MHVYAQNKSAIAFYQRMGMSISQPADRAYICMTKTLG